MLGRVSRLDIYVLLVLLYLDFALGVVYSATSGRISEERALDS